MKYLITLLIHYKYHFHRNIFIASRRGLLYIQDHRVIIHMARLE